ncbi:hypothetical protein ACOQ7M_001617 [Campylobacter jejuni]|nr:hypothetical protein [Campylobacter jejuni]EGP7953201.1 hypothetical protein [Campylobacter jejuni]EGP7985189.1 hypothetical protein [Campylobacter jejuni]EGS6930353.1 hypothetical protein [Campylobacter jejuni]EHN8256045.1 hypothetical protein [Campylobacter jejuni]
MAANITVPVTVDTNLRDCLNRIIAALNKLNNTNAPVTEETIKDIRNEQQSLKSEVSSSISKSNKVLAEIDNVLDDIYKLKEEFTSYNDLMQQLESYVLPTLINMYNDINKLKEEMLIVQQTLAGHATRIEQLETRVQTLEESVANHIQYCNTKFEDIEQRLKVLETN